MSTVTLDRPWLEFDLGQEMQVLSWAVHRPGLVRARRILWRAVRNADLAKDLDVENWLAGALQARGAGDAVTFLTSCDIRDFTQATAIVGVTKAHTIATVSLSNAERVGHRVDRSGQNWGTINVALRLNRCLTDTALPRHRLQCTGAMCSRNWDQMTSPSELKTAMRCSSTWDLPSLRWISVSVPQIPRF